jgi:hypothetical protein
MAASAGANGTTDARGSRHYTSQIIVPSTVKGKTALVRQRCHARASSEVCAINCSGISASGRYSSSAWPSADCCTKDSHPSVSCACHSLLLWGRATSSCRCRLVSVQCRHLAQVGSGQPRGELIVLISCQQAVIVT